MPEKYIYQEPTPPNLLEDLKKQMYSYETFELSQSEIQEMGQIWQKFASLPLIIKQELAFPLREIGFQRLSNNSLGDEYKEYFHYNRHIENNIRLIAKKYEKEYPIIGQFLSVARRIYVQCVRSFKDFSDKMEVVGYPEIKKTLFPVTDGRKYKYKYPDFYLRFNCYKETKNNILFKGHFDTNVATLQVGESNSGLRIGSNGLGLQPVFSQDGKAIIFMGSSQKEVLRDGLKPAFHDVVKDGSTNKSLRNGDRRWSIVMFANSAEIYERRSKNTELQMEKVEIKLSLENTGSEIRNSIIKDQNLTNAKVDWSVISNCNFQTTNLFNADFWNTEFNQSSFSNCNLELANFEDCGITGITFAGCDLKSTKLSKINLSNVDFRSNNCEESYFYFSNLSNANFKKTNCRKANFDWSNCSGVDFSGTNLTGAKLTSANLNGANFEGADLTDADFTGSDVTNCIFTNSITTNVKW